MLTLDVFNETGQKVGQVDFDESTLGEKIRKRLMHDYVIMFEANQRQGNAKTKTVAEVAGSGKKIYKQKHTGRARAHYRRSHLRTHGGVAHGPVPRDYHYQMPRRAKREALKSALLSKFIDKEVVVLDALSFAEPKSNRLKKALKANNVNRSALIVIPEYDKNLTLSARNVPTITLSPSKEINAYQVLVANRVVFTKAALEGLAAWISTHPGTAGNNSGETETAAAAASAGK